MPLTPTVRYTPGQPLQGFAAQNNMGYNAAGPYGQNYTPGIRTVSASPISVLTNPALNLSAAIATRAINPLQAATAMFSRPATQPPMMAPSAPRPLIGSVVDNRAPSLPPAQITYNQPFNYNRAGDVTKNVSVNVPDMFKPTPIPPTNLDVSPMSPMNIGGRNYDPTQLLAMGGNDSVPVAANPFRITRTDGGAPPVVAPSPQAQPINLQPQQARFDDGNQAPQDAPPLPTAPRRIPRETPVYQTPPPQYMPPVNPYARQAPPPPPVFMPPQMPNQQSWDRMIGGMLPQQRFYQPPPPPDKSGRGRFGRALNAWAQALNPNIAAVEMARAKAQSELYQKQMEMDKELLKTSADNVREMAKEMMNQGGQDRRTAFTQDVEIYKAQLQAQTAGKLTQSQGLESLGNALKMTPQTAEDLQVQFTMLRTASEALGQDYTHLTGKTSTEGANAALKQAMDMKKDALALLKAKNDVDQIPIENQIKQLEKALKVEQVREIPLDRQAKQLQMAASAATLAEKTDPELKALNKAKLKGEIAGQDDQSAARSEASIMRHMQMGSSTMAQANATLQNIFLNASVDPDGKLKKQAFADLARGQQMQHTASLALNPQMRMAPAPGTPIDRNPESPIVQAYLMMANGDWKKATELAKADGWMVPGEATTKPGVTAGKGKVTAMR